MPDSGRYRVLPDGLLLDRERFEPVALADPGGGDDGEEHAGDTDGERVDDADDGGERAGEHAALPADLRPGYLIDATLDWSTPEPRLRSVDVVQPTLYAFADGVEPMFELAESAWRDARSAGEAMESRVAHDTDNEVVGVVYVFAEGGDRGRLEEFRDGSRPLEPLVDRVDEERGPAPREVFVLRERDGEFTAVVVVFDKGGQLADTVRDTYDLSRPDEPLVD